MRSLRSLQSSAVSARGEGWLPFATSRNFFTKSRMVLISFDAICYRISPIRHRDEVSTNNARLVIKRKYNQLIANGWIRQNKCALKPATE